jgi:PrtD family type I secretion system ABC transporter
MAAEDGLLTRARPVLGAAFTFSLFTNLLMLSIPIYSLQVYDRVLASRSVQTLAMLAMVVLGALLVHFTLESVRSRLMVHVGLWLDRAWAPELLRRAVRRGPDPDGPPGAGVLRDLNAVRNFITGPGVFNLFDAPWVPVYIVVMFILHPYLGVLTTAGAVALFAVAWVTDLATRAPLREASVKMVVQQALADAYVARAEVIESMGMLPGIAALWEDGQDETRRLLERGWHRSAFLAAMARFGRFLVQVAVVTVGAWLAIDNRMSAGTIVAGSILLTRALAPVESLVASWKSLAGARSAYDRIQDELAKPLPGRSTTHLPRPSGRLVLERVTVQVPGTGRKVLSAIDLDLAPGESLGIIGPSAAGKTTLARVILGLLPPSEGRARLDGADVATWSREDFGRHIGYLPQDIELFASTVKRNIARMDDPDDERVVEAAMLAGVHEMILRLPLGYDTPIADVIRNLSGGQRQRIAIARAFYGQPRLMVLDEPNSNLDSDGENALIRALAHARDAGVTAVVIAHRARVLMTVDRLLLLRDGRAELLGPREEVMARVLPPASGGHSVGLSPKPIRGDGPSPI